MLKLNIQIIKVAYFTFRVIILKKTKINIHKEQCNRTFTKKELLSLV